MSRLEKEEAVRQLRVAAALVLLLSMAYYSKMPSRANPDLPTVLGAAIAVIGVLTAIALWRLESLSRKLFVLWCSLAAAAVVYPTPPLPDDRLWSAVVALLYWCLLAVLARQVYRGMRALPASPGDGVGN